MEKVKVAISGFMTALSSCVGALVIPVLLLVFCNIVDYATGLCASKYRGEAISSYKGMRGIVKKIGMWLLICIGVILDQLIVYTMEQLGWTTPFTFFIACFVAIWLTVNEIISILENLNDIGVPLPPFLQPIVKHLKSKVEAAAEEKIEPLIPEENCTGATPENTEKDG